MQLRSERCMHAGIMQGHQARAVVDWLHVFLVSRTLLRSTFGTAICDIRTPTNPFHLLLTFPLTAPHQHVLHPSSSISKHVIHPSKIPQQCSSSLTPPPLPPRFLGHLGHRPSNRLPPLDKSHPRSPHTAAPRRQRASQAQLQRHPPHRRPRSQTQCLSLARHRRDLAGTLSCGMGVQWAVQCDVDGCGTGRVAGWV